MYICNFDLKGSFRPNYDLVFAPFTWGLSAPPLIVVLKADNPIPHSGAPVVGRPRIPPPRSSRSALTVYEIYRFPTIGPPWANTAPRGY